MRAIKNINSSLLSAMQSSRDAILARLMGDSSILTVKGGDRYSHVLERPTPNFPHTKKEMKTSYTKNLIDSQTVNLLIRAAEWVRERGQVRAISEDPVLEEQLGILFNIIRRRKKITLGNLASKSGIEIEELIAFEAGLLPRLRICEVLPELAKGVGVNQEHLLQLLRHDTKKTDNK